MEKNKQYVVQPPTVEKCQELIVDKTSGTVTKSPQERRMKRERK
jgi:hypothetical protein